MGKYRIIRHRYGKPEQGEFDSGQAGAADRGQYWQEAAEGFAADLDFQEIAELNHLPEQQPPARIRQILRAMLAALTLLAFISLLSLDLVPYFHLPDLSFLSRSAQLAQDETLQALKEAVVIVEGAKGSGSGFNMRADGLIVTNRHVVEDNSAISVVFPDGSRFAAREWQYVEDYDLALALIKGKDLPHVRLAASLPQPGDDLIFIGNPLGFDWTISEGQMLETLDFAGDTILYFSGPVRSGSSGSPLFNAQGQVEGVIFASLRDIADSGLAIPGSLLLTYLE